MPRRTHGVKNSMVDHAIAVCLLRASWSRPKQIDLIFGKGQFRKRLPPSAQLPLSDNDFSGSPHSATDTDIISAQHF